MPLPLHAMYIILLLSLLLLLRRRRQPRCLMWQQCQVRRWPDRAVAPAAALARVSLTTAQGQHLQDDANSKIVILRKGYICNTHPDGGTAAHCTVNIRLESCSNACSSHIRCRHEAQVHQDNIKRSTFCHTLTAWFTYMRCLEKSLTLYTPEATYCVTHWHSPNAGRCHPQCCSLWQPCHHSSAYQQRSACGASADRFKHSIMFQGPHTCSSSASPSQAPLMPPG